MRKWQGFVPMVILIFSMKVQAQELKLLKTTFLPHYPSASTLEYANNKLYVIGDDATQLLVLDSDHRPQDSMVLFENKGLRLSKKSKADLESTILVRKNGRDYLVAFPSFSAARRDQVMVVDVAGKSTKTLSRARFRVPGIRDLNVEGAALVADHLLLSTRANESQRENYLLVSKFDLESGIEEKNIRAIPLQLPAQKNLAGISSISYLPGEDLLLFTASTELTDNSFSDGAIGDSYLGYIENISRKLNSDRLVADAFVNVSKTLGQGPHKIESVVVEARKGKELILHLASDNDNGASTLFKLSWKVDNP